MGFNGVFSSRPRSFLGTFLISHRFVFLFVRLFFLFLFCYFVGGTETAAFAPNCIPTERPGPLTNANVSLDRRKYTTKKDSPRDFRFRPHLGSTCSGGGSHRRNVKCNHSHISPPMPPPRAIKILNLAFNRTAPPLHPTMVRSLTWTPQQAHFANLGSTCGGQSP